MPATTLLIGAHVGQDDPVAEALACGADLVQIFLGDPQGWKGPEVAHADGPEGLRAAAEAAGVALYVHAPYVINVATTNNRVRIPSRKLLQQTVDAAAALGARGVVVHGGHVTKDDDPAAGHENWRKAVERLDPKVPVLIENTAGGDRAMARRLEAIERTWAAVTAGAEAAGTTDRIGFCLDTCHAHAAGLDLAEVVDRIRAVTGRIDLVHGNDSRDGFDSGRDRHANFGTGQIDPDALVAVVAAAGAPVVCETPGELADRAADIAWLRRRLAADSPTGQS